jgi:hypothetical protein
LGQALRKAKKENQTMNQQQIETVQESFEFVRPIADVAADLFYDRLFALDPALQPMFKGEMGEQKTKLMSTLAFAVAGLNQPERILPAVRQLGTAARGVRGAEQPLRDSGRGAVVDAGAGAGRKVYAGRRSGVDGGVRAAGGYDAGDSGGWRIR